MGSWSTGRFWTQDTQLTVLNVLTVCQLSQSHRHRQELHPCLAGNAKWHRLKRRVRINTLPYTTLVMAIQVTPHYLSFMTITSHLWRVRSKPTTTAAQCGYLPCHPNSTCTVCGMAGNQTTCPVSQEGNPIHRDFFIQVLLPTLSTVAHFLTEFSCHRLDCPFKLSHPGIASLVIATVLFSLHLKLGIYLLSKPIKLEFQKQDMYLTFLSYRQCVHQG